MFVSMNKTIGFSSTPLFPVNLKAPSPNGGLSLKPATFSELNHNSSTDGEAMLEIYQNWANTEYGQSIADNFIKQDANKKRFFCIEELGSAPLASRINSLVMTSNPTDNNLELKLLQASPYCSYKGRGEVSLYGIAKEAQRLGVEKIELISTNDGFYDAIDIPEVEKLDGGSYRSFQGVQIDNYIEKTNQKYKMGR